MSPSGREKYGSISSNCRRKLEIRWPARNFKWKQRWEKQERVYLLTHTHGATSSNQFSSVQISPLFSWRSQVLHLPGPTDTCETIYTSSCNLTFTMLNICILVIRQLKTQMLLMVLLCYFILKIGGHAFFYCSSVHFHNISHWIILLMHYLSLTQIQLKTIIGLAS